jgi:hypothetical protein
MERRLYEREKELTELRPMRAGHDEMTEKIRVQEQTIMELTKELQNAKDDVAQRDAMVAELMRQQGERLSQEELAKAKGGGGGGGGNAAASGGSASGATTAMGQPVPESAVRIEGLVKDVDKLLGGTVKKRLPCAGYRLLLPNLMGYRPERPRRWTLRCMRSIMRAKQLDDSRCERSGQLRTRFPDFVYAWFEPPTHVLVGAESGEAREAIMADADEDRWGLYYGVKALSRELPEARLFYNFLDEKYGEDELTFFLYCLRVLDAEAWRKGNGGIDWGRPYWMTPMNNATIAGADGGKTAGEGASHGGGRQHDTSGMTSDGAGNDLAPTSLERINTILRRQKEDGMEEDDEDDDDLRESDPEAFCPTVVFITQETVRAVLDVVMKRSGGSANESEEVKNALFRNLIRKTAPVEVGRLPESVAIVTKRSLTSQLNMLSSEVHKNMAAEQGEDDGDSAAPRDAFDVSDEDEAALEAEKKRFKENVQCVEAGGLLRGLLQEYREEQAHRRAAIRLMFQTATNPGADAAADVAVAGDADGSAGAAAGGGGASTAAVDMQQFRSMCESLHSKVPFREVVALYRDAYEIGGGGGQDGGTGKGVVDFDSFSAAADNRQFFSSCLRLPGFVGAAERNAEQMGLDMMRGRIGELNLHWVGGGGGGGVGDDCDGESGDGGGGGGGGGGGTSNPQASASSQLSQGFSFEECSRLAAVVARHVKLFETTIEEHYLAKALPGEARVRVRHQLDALREDIRQSCSGLAPDGRRALCSYRRLLDTLMYERMERLQQIGDNKIPGEVSGSRLDRIDRELDGVETILREFTVAPGVMKLRRVIRFLAVVRIQRCWRSYLAKSSGVPLSLRPMMTKAFTAPTPGSLTLKSEAWLLQQLDTLYHEKLMSDARCDAGRLPRVDFAAFLYDHHLYKFGVREIAEFNLHTLFFNVRKHADRPSCARAKIFALQTGMGDELNLSIESRFRVGSDSSARAARQAATMVGATMTPEHWMETSFSLEFYLRCVISLAAASTANRSGLYPYSRQEENTGQSSLPLDQACKVLAATLGKDHAGANVHFSESEIVVLQSRARDMARGASGGAGGDASRINVDDLLELVMCRWATKMRDREVDLRKIFRAGDVDLNNVLSFGTCSPALFFVVVFLASCFSQLFL